MDDFKATRLPAETLISMHDEIVAGEQMNSFSSEMQYREQVKAHSEKKAVKVSIPKSGALSAGAVTPRPSGAGIHGRRRVGERLPGRDPVRSLVERTKLQKGGV